LIPTKRICFRGRKLFWCAPYHSRFDGFSGALIKVKSDVVGSQIGIDLSRKAVRHLDIINFNGKKYLLVSINNAKVEVYEMPMSNL
jgi:hypothetical protein